MIKQFFLFRHGQTDWNEEKRLQGSSDLSLNDHGIVQAETLSDVVLDNKIELIVSSPLKRAYETALIANKKANARLIVDPRLVEIDFGKYEGYKLDALKAEYGEKEFIYFITSTDESQLDNKMDGGESKRQARDRVMAALKDIALNNYEKTIGIFFHGLVLSLTLSSIGMKEPLPLSNGDTVHIEASVNNNIVKWKYINFMPNPFFKSKML